MKMMETIRALWAYSPKETAAMIAVAIVCSTMMAALIGMLMWPTAPERMEEAR